MLVVSCDIFNPPGEVIEHNLLVAYKNKGNEFYLIDYNTYEIEPKILQNSDSLSFVKMFTSTNNDYLIFIAQDTSNMGFVVCYDISKDSIDNIFPLHLQYVRPASTIAAHLSTNPGLFYLYSPNIGMYSVDYITEKVNLVSTEKYTYRDYFAFPNNKWIMIFKEIPSNEYSYSYSELEFYKVNSKLQRIDFVLNKNDVDSIAVNDMIYSEKDDKLFLSYLTSQRKDVFEKAYFGSYDMTTLKFDTSHVVLPWSNNPYYIAYSSDRDECYMCGASSTFYIIGLDSTKYYIKDTVELIGKISSPSRIAVRPDHRMAFVSCYNNNLVYVVDLETKQVHTTISIDTPYQLVFI
jgi:hypothetical protein